MNKAEMIHAIAEGAALEKEVSAKVLDAVINAIIGALKTGDEVRLVGFGSFAVSERAASEGRNPRTGESIKVAASKSVKFRSGKELKASLNPA